jgi:hypothetical protein
MITRTTFLLREIYRELRNREIQRLFYTLLRYRKPDLIAPRKVTYYGEPTLSIRNALQI